MNRTAEAEAVDAAFGALESAVLKWLRAGGNADLAAQWLVASVAGISPEMSRAVVRSASTGIQNKSYRLRTLADADPGAAEPVAAFGGAQMNATAGATDAPARESQSKPRASRRTSHADRV